MCCCASTGTTPHLLTAAAARSVQSLLTAACAGPAAAGVRRRLRGRQQQRDRRRRAGRPRRARRHLGHAGAPAVRLHRHPALPPGACGCRAASLQLALAAWLRSRSPSAGPEVQHILEALQSGSREMRNHCGLYSSPAACFVSRHSTPASRQATQTCLIDDVWQSFWSCIQICVLPPAGSRQSRGWRRCRAAGCWRPPTRTATWLSQMCAPWAAAPQVCTRSSCNPGWLTANGIRKAVQHTLQLSWCREDTHYMTSASQVDWRKVLNAV
jgi:hypothetical protein